MPVIDAAFYPLIITNRPTEYPYAAPPVGTDMSALRLLPASEVRAGDLVLGAYDGPVSPGKLRTANQSAAAFTALPLPMHGVICLDGETPLWERDEPTLVIPREYRPSAPYAVGDLVERPVLYTPTDYSGRYRPGETVAVLQRGTVTAVEDGSVSIQWLGDWLTCEDPATGFRRVDPVRIERERAVSGFAVGDRVTLPGGTSTGVVMELWPRWLDGRTTARVWWPPTSASDNSRGRHRMYEPYHIEHAVPAASATR
ncbi:hypothetical protein [Streptomyces rimosus]|uniref:hypothetical protein n=1 Tax=Streptomyces rimosus TaxID=1927 RepID=UPI0004BFE6C7|nr:hypothetical protein [Streptomyces rimosus]